MSEELSEVLADLARQMGTTTGHLWDYLQGSGLHDYAMATIAVDAAECFVLLIVTIACIVIIAKNYKNAKDLDDDGAFLLTLGSVLIGTTCAIFFAVTVTELVGWVVSPEGMVIREITKVLMS